jgi:hypothetical protein
MKLTVSMHRVMFTPWLIFHGIIWWFSLNWRCELGWTGNECTRYAILHAVTSVIHSVNASLCLFWGRCQFASDGMATLTGSTQPREYNWGATWWKNSGSCLENREYGRRDQSRWPRGILYPQKLAITSPTSGGRSVGIVRSRTQTMEFVCLFGMATLVMDFNVIQLIKLFVINLYCFWQGLLNNIKPGRDSRVYKLQDQCLFSNFFDRGVSFQIHRAQQRTDVTARREWQ